MSLNSFISLLKKQRNYLSKQQYLTLKGQAVAGDIFGAIKGLTKLIERKSI